MINFVMMLMNVVFMYVVGFVCEEIFLKLVKLLVLLGFLMMVFVKILGFGLLLWN